MEPGSIDFPPCSLHLPGGLCQSFQVQLCCFLRRFKYTVHQLRWAMWYTVLINPWFWGTNIPQIVNWGQGWTAYYWKKTTLWKIPKVDSADAWKAIGLSKNGHPMLRQEQQRELPLQHLPEFLPLKMTIAFHFTKLAGILKVIWGPSSLKKQTKKVAFVGQIFREFSPHQSPLTPKILRKWIVVDPGCLYEESHQNLIKSLKKIAFPNLGVTLWLVDPLFQHFPTLSQFIVGISNVQDCSGFFLAMINLWSPRKERPSLVSSNMERSGLNLPAFEDRPSERNHDDTGADLLVSFIYHLKIPKVLSFVS